VGGATDEDERKVVVAADGGGGRAGWFAFCVSGEGGRQDGAEEEEGLTA